MAQIVLYIDIKPTGVKQRVSQSNLGPFCQTDLWVQSSQRSSTEDLTFNLGTKGPQKEKVSETQQQGWLCGLLIVKHNKRNMKDAHGIYAEIFHSASRGVTRIFGMSYTQIFVSVFAFDCVCVCVCVCVLSVWL